MNRLDGKVCLVTGSASGIGKRIAEVYAANGAKVVIADLKLDAAQATATEISQCRRRCLRGGDGRHRRGAGRSRRRRCDRALRPDRRAGVECRHPDRQHDRPSSLSPTGRRCWRSISTAPSSPRAPACATWSSARPAARSSTWARCIRKEASKLKAPYVTAKHGLLGLARVVAKEGAEYGVRANVICPGFVRTPLVEKQIPGTGEGTRHQRGRGRQERDAQGHRRRRVHHRRRRRQRRACSSRRSRPMR